MNRLRRAWDALWFEPIHAAQLALLRILVGGFSLWFLAQRYTSFLHIAGTDPALFKPVGLAWLLHGEGGLPALLRLVGADGWANALAGPVDADWFGLILGATLALNALFVLGFQFRITGPAFAGLLLWVLCYRNSWTMIYHSSNLLLLHVVILGLTPSANALSLDSLLRRRLRATRWLRGAWPPTDSPVDWRYGWPLRLIMAGTTVTYFLAGMAKVTGPLGWSWASGSSLLTYIHRDSIRKELLGGSATDAAYHVHEMLGLLTLFATLTLVIELGAPLVMLGARGSRFRTWAPAIWAFSVWCMHWGILLIMGIEFRYQRSGIAFAAFLPLGLLIEKLRRPPGSPAAR